MPPKWFLEDRRGGRGGHAKGRARFHPKFRPRLRTEAANGPPRVWPQDRSSRNMDLTPLCPACPPSPFKTRGPWPSSQAANSPPYLNRALSAHVPRPPGRECCGSDDELHLCSDPDSKGPAAHSTARHLRPGPGTSRILTQPAGFCPGLSFQNPRTQSCVGSKVSLWTR